MNVKSLPKDTSSSSGTLFAKPTKEWVLPERAKPGRKISKEEPDSRRQSQNRQSQRAFRERKSSYLTTLEDRLRQYEQNEISSNVQLQHVARALKEDNERLKKELAEAKAEIALLSGDDIKVKIEIEEPIKGKGRATTSRGRPIARPPTQRSHPAPLPSPTDSARSSTSSRASPPFVHPIYQFDNRANSSMACPICPDPDPNCACRHVARMPMCSNCSAPTSECICKPDVSYIDFTGVDRPGDKPKAVINPCGFCEDPSAVCVCRIAQEEAGFDPTPPPTISVSSLLSNFPPPEAPVKIRLRPRKDGVKAVPIFQILPQRDAAVCSGDPGNCEACRDDDFGREFCERLADSVCTGDPSNRCSTCPVPHDMAPPRSPLSLAPLQLACCGTPELCGSNAGQCSGESLTSMPVEPTEPVQPPEETMRCDEAWRALKAHPNVTHASLSLLADVVARRTKCTGPRVELSPERQIEPPPQGQKRRLEVETSAVRNALALLDASPSSSPHPEGDWKKRRVVVITIHTNMELSTEDKSKLAAEFIEQAPPGEVNDVINDIRAVVASDEALMPHVLPRLRAYNLAQLHVVEHGSSTSLVSTAAILNGSNGDSERYVDPRAKKSFALDHVTLTASSYEDYVLPEEFESVRATLDNSVQAYTRDHFATGICAVFSSANHVQPQTSEPQDSVGVDKEIGDDEVKAALEGVVRADEAAGSAERDNAKLETADQSGADAADNAASDPEHSAELESTKPEESKPEQSYKAEGGEPARDAAATKNDEAETPPSDASDPAKGSEEAVPEMVAEPHEHAIVTDEEATCEPTDADKPQDGKSVAEDPGDETQADQSNQGDQSAPSDHTEATVLPEVANPVYTVQIVGNRYNPQNFWTGRWRSTWIVEPERVTGTIHVDVHYYEQGNVQLATSHTATFDYTDVAKVVDTIAKLEAEYQLALNDTYNALGDKAFKSLRRALPVTRQKVEWEKISGYKLGADLRA